MASTAATGGVGNLNQSNFDQKSRSKSIIATTQEIKSKKKFYILHFAIVNKNITKFHHFFFSMQSLSIK
jgi:hypothetical protein